MSYVAKFLKDNKISGCRFKIIDCINIFNSKKDSEFIGKMTHIMPFGYRILFTDLEYKTDLVNNIVSNGNFFIISCKDKVFTVKRV